MLKFLTASLEPSISNSNHLKVNTFGSKVVRAHVEVKSFTLYPDFAVSKGEKEGLSKWKLRCLQKQRIKSLKIELAKGQPVKSLTRYFISLPSEEAHSGHPS